MAEVTRSFDLKSWQGLTEVLKVARESNLAPLAYSKFRNLVLEYAQQKGTDSELKKKIDAIISTFGEQRQASPQAPVTIAPSPHHAEKSSKVVSSSETGRPAFTQESQAGRRVVPSFAPQATITPVIEPVPTTVADAPPVPLVRVLVPEAVASKDEAPKPQVPPQISNVPESNTVKSIEEHRLRILEIKRRVNGLVGNPITLMDHGNNIGREYMSALLSALKATSPGTTLNAGEAMSALEIAFAKILEHASHGTEPTVESTPEVIVSPEVVEVKPEESIENPIEIETQESEPPATPVPEATVQEEEKNTEDLPEPEPTPESEPENKLSEAGGDVDLESQIKNLRAELKAREIEVPNRPAKRSLIPSIMEMEEDPIPVTVPDMADEDPHKIEDELSTKTLTNRANSTMTGITLGTPQAELASPEITAALSDFLHQWNIFAASGIFGMGPAGIEHPLYIQLSRLPMGEVLSGRFDDADMKTVHLIKGYVDAWRHEQGIAYNPTETFEHYLRRVTQRILKRQNGTQRV